MWVSNGTAAGTIPLTLPAGASGAANGLFAATGASATAAPLVYFTVGSSVYRSDGTTAGTTAVTLPGSAGATVAGATTAAVGTLGTDVILYVSSAGSAFLWLSDGTSAGSTDLGPATPGLTPGNQSLTVNGYSYFSLSGELFATAGAAGTTSAQAFTGGSALYDFSVAGSDFFFVATGGSLGTAAALDVSSGPGAGALTLNSSAQITDLTVLNSSLLFVTADSSGNYTMMVTNGTMAGTTTLIGPGLITDIQDVGVVAGTAFFVGEQSGALNLYTTGSSGGLTSVKALGAPASFTYASGTVSLSGQAAFLAPASGSDVTLWTSFGITATTNSELADAPAGTLAMSGSNLLFDATPAPASAAAAVAVGGAASGPGQLYVLNGTGTGIGSGTGSGGTTGGGGSGGSGTTGSTGTAALSASVTAVTLPSVFVPGDTGIARLEITNNGTAAAIGTLSVQLYLSPDGTLADAVPLLAPAVERVAIRLPAGKIKALAARFVVPPNVTPGSEQLLAVLTPLTGISPTDVSATPAAAAGTATAALSFGTIGTRKNVRLTSAVDGAPIVYRLIGPGTATLTPQPDGNDALSVTGTTAKSSIVISVGGKVDTQTLDSISIDGPIAQLIAPKINLAGNFTVNGNVRRVQLDNISGAVIAFTGSAPVVVALGNVVGSSIYSSDPIATLSASSWVAAAGAAPGVISASSIGIFLDKGDLSADVATASIKELVVRGDVSDSAILAGTYFGANGIAGGGDDTFAAGTIGVVQILGSVSGDSTIAAGLDLTDDLLPPDATDTLLAGGRINGLTIRGQLDSGSLVLAATLPKRAAVGGHVVSTIGATGFVLP